MTIRNILLGLFTILLAGALLVGAVSAAEPTPTAAWTAVPQKVRDYAAAVEPGDVSYMVDGGALLAGAPETGWRPLQTPEGVIVNAVAVDTLRPDTLYIGAANEMALYVSSDAGASWMRIPLDTQAVGAVTDIAVDPVNHLVYVGTDTDGVHRLRDVGTSMIASGHLLLDEPVVQVATDSTGAGLTFVRTTWTLYRAEEMGLRWVAVENLPSPATALAIAQTTPPTVYVGTANSGIRMSHDGVNWEPVNEGLGFGPGVQVFVHDLAVDPAQPQVLYASTSYVFGSASGHMTPAGVAMSTDGLTWQELAPPTDVAVVELLPVTGRTGAVYGLTETSRTPVALGSAPDMAAAVAPVVTDEAAPSATGLLAWILAGGAALVLVLLIGMDLRQRRRTRGGEPALAPRRVK